MRTGIKYIIAGPFRLRILGQIPDQENRKGHRAARENPTSPAQAFYNDKRSWKELRLWITTNFNKRAVVVTTTYSDEFLPSDKKSAEKGLWKKYIRRLQSGRKRRGQDFKYIYTTEGFHGRAARDIWDEDGCLEDRRIHHHFIVNIESPEDMEELRSLWPGGGYVKIEPFDVRYSTALAKYMTKEAREFGRAKPGDRTWKRSMNLIKYQVEYMEIPITGMCLAPPPGAVDYETFHERNPYGFADCIGDQYFLFSEQLTEEYSYNQGPRKKPPYI